MASVTVSVADGVSLTGDAVGHREDSPVLLFHGGGQTRHALGNATKALGAKGWHATTFDLRGHGDSDWSPDGIYNLDRFAGDVAGAASGYHRPVLVGASLGGLASLLAIGEGLVPDAAGLVLVDVTPTLDEGGLERIRAFMQLGVDGFAGLDDVAEAIASYVPTRDRPVNLDSLRKNVRQRPDGKWVWHWDPRFFDRIGEGGGEPTAGSFSPPERLDAACRRVRVPTLLVRGGASDVVSDSGEQLLREQIPQLEVVVVSGAGHMVAGDRNDRFNAAVIEFLERAVREPADEGDRPVVLGS